MVVLHHEVANTYRIAGNFRGVKYFLYFRGQADLHEFFTPRNYSLYGIQRGHIKSFTHSWGQLCVAQPVSSPHPGRHSNTLHRVTWLCPYHHMHSHGSSGRGKHPHNKHLVYNQQYTDLSEHCPVVTVPHHPSHLYNTHSQTQ